MTTASSGLKYTFRGLLLSVTLVIGSGCAVLTPQKTATLRATHPGETAPYDIQPVTASIPDTLPPAVMPEVATGPNGYATLHDLDHLYRTALGLVSEDRYDAAQDHLFVLQNLTSQPLPASADSTYIAHYRSLRRSQSLLAAILVERMSFAGSAAHHDSLLAAGYTRLQASGLPDSLIPATGITLDSMTADLITVDNQAVRQWEAYFTGRGRKTFQHWLERQATADSLVGKILAAEGLPPQLIYLAMIESGLSSTAVSSVGAAGPWQFMPGTASDYGLQHNWWLDERRDLEMSTRAAARYLKDLYRRFDDWALVLAAYNSGGGRVSRKIRQHGHDNFWDMRLPRQTTAYVPKFIAAVHIGEDPGKYGFTVPTSRRLHYDTLPVDDATDLALIARCAGVDAATLTALNPALLRGATPPDTKNYPVRLPVETVKATRRKLAAVPADKRLTWRQHKVKRGETLGGIALLYGTSTHDISRVNKMKNIHVIRPGDELLIPMPSELVGKARRRAAEKGHYVPPAGYQRVSYKVKSGDTLGRIANKLHVTVKHLRKVNNLHQTNLIHPGERLYAYRPKP